MFVLLLTSFQFMVSPDQVHLLSVFQTESFTFWVTIVSSLSLCLWVNLSISIQPLNLDQSEFKAYIEENLPPVLLCTVPIIILNKMYQD
jgi:uncharacterized protein with PQ loop repeat